MSGDSGDHAGDRRYLLVRSGGQRFAIPVTTIAALQRDLVVHPVPGGREPLLGVGQLAGEPVLVVDLLELADGEVGGQQVTVVVKRTGPGGSESVGLAVDDADRIVTITDVDSTGDLGRGIGGSAVVGDSTVRIVDPAALAERGSTDAPAE